LTRRPPRDRRFSRENERTDRPVRSHQESTTTRPNTLLRVAGVPAVSALFRHAPDRVVRLFYEERQARQLGDFCARMAKARRPYRKVDGDELTKIAGTVLHGGVVAIAEPQSETLLTAAECRRLMNLGTTLFVLDGIGNPHNVGAIARSLAFFGFGHLVLSGHPLQAGLSDAAYRIAEGGLDCLTVFRATNLTELLGKIKGHGRIVGTALGDQGQTLEALQLQSKSNLILLGNEEQGLARATLSLCDEILTLPGSGAVQSLNVAATVAIIAHALRPG